MNELEQLYQHIIDEEYSKATRLYEQLDESQKTPELIQTIAMVYSLSDDGEQQQKGLQLLLSIRDQITDVMDYYEDLSTMYCNVNMWSEYEQLAQQCIQMVETDPLCDPDGKLSSITEYLYLFDDDEEALFDDDADEMPTPRPPISHDAARVEQVIALMRREAHPACHRITLHEEPCSIYVSKVGGVPYLPVGAEHPCCADGSPLRFLAQIRLDEMPLLADFPSRGMLQFYLKDMYEDDEARVIYHEQVDENIAQQAIPAEEVDAEDRYFPFAPSYCRRMRFSETETPLPKYTGRIRELLHRCWDEVFPEEQGGYGDLYETDPESDQRISEVCLDADGHLVGGYGFFAQDDPCDCDEHREKSIQLLQLGSDDEIMWGDCGLGHFFISPDKLRQRDFSDCLFYWDCY